MWLRLWNGKGCLQLGGGGVEVAFKVPDPPYGLRKEIEQCSPSQLCRKVSLTLNLRVVNLNPCNKSHLTPNLFQKIPEMYFLMFLPELLIQRLYDFKMKAPQKLHMRFFH